MRGARRLQLLSGGGRIVGHEEAALARGAQGCERLGHALHRALGRVQHPVAVKDECVSAGQQLFCGHSRYCAERAAAPQPPAQRSGVPMAAECAAQHAAARYMDWHPQRSCRGVSLRAHHAKMANGARSARSIAARSADDDARK